MPKGQYYRSVTITIETDLPPDELKQLIDHIDAKTENSVVRIKMTKHRRSDLALADCLIDPALIAAVQTAA